jgi:hypothetical protein
MPRRGIGALRQAIDDFIETSPLGEFIHSLRVRFVEGIEKETAHDVLAPLLSNIDTSELPPEYRRLINQMKRGDQQGLAALVIGAVVGAAVGTVAGAARPISRKIEQQVEDRVHSGLLTPYEAVILELRGLYGRDNTRAALSANGYPESFRRAFLELNRRLVDPQTLVRHFWRSPGDRENIRDKLISEGYDEHDVNRLIAAGEYLPGVQDLILFAVREVFTPDIAERYGQFDEFPDEFANRAALLGLSRDNARFYWASHWQNPSIQTGFEMLHRLRPGKSDNPFTAEDLSRLIKAHDITPYWRPRLEEISYSPITRVDIRRLFRDGVVDSDKVYDNYLDLGYNPENARLLTEWTARQNEPGQKDLTRAAIQKAYELGIFTEQEAIAALTDIGYDTVEAQFWLGLTVAQSALSEQKERVDYLEYLYLNGEINEQELHSRLSALELSTDAIRRTVDVLNIRRQKAVKLPSLTDLRNFYNEDIITADEYRDYLRRKNYQDAAISQIIQYADLLEARQRTKEVEAAQKEEERLRTAELASVVRRDKAQIDVQIAELRSDIADLKVASHETEDGDELENIKLRIDQLKAEIAELRVDKATTTLSGT